MPCFHAHKTNSQDTRLPRQIRPNPHPMQIGSKPQERVIAGPVFRFFVHQMKKCSPEIQVWQCKLHHSKAAAPSAPDSRIQSKLFPMLQSDDHDFQIPPSPSRADHRSSLPLISIWKCTRTHGSYASGAPYSSSSASTGTPGRCFDWRMVSEVRTLATLGAGVSFSVRKLWKVERSGATHFRMKSISPLSMWHSRTSGQLSTSASNALRSASAWLCSPTMAKTVTSKPSDLPSRSA